MLSRILGAGVLVTCLSMAACTSGTTAGPTVKGDAASPSASAGVLESATTPPSSDGANPSSDALVNASGSESPSASVSASASASDSPSASPSPSITISPDSGDAFYDPPSPLPSEPGTLLRVEPLGTPVPGGTGLRILYVSQAADGTPVASSGMVFVPDKPAPAEGRRIVAWAHPTVGLGDKCAPSRRPEPLKTISGWLPDMMQRGWIVTATDYAGLGTPGPSMYLDGQSEARDVVNSVRAVRQVPNADAGSEWVAWGHSQGGHSVLWTGQLAAELAPDLNLLAVAAAAPAAELTKIMSVQWRTPVAWVIAPEVMESWPRAYPGQDFAEPLSITGKAARGSVARMCITQAAILGLMTKYIGVPFFKSPPLENEAWSTATKAQTPDPLPASIPLMLVQSTSDEVVMAWPNAKLQEDWCKAGTDLTAMWLSGIGHMTTADDAGGTVVEWIDNRFAGKPTQNTCDIPPPPVPQPQ